MFRYTSADDFVGKRLRILSKPWVWIAHKELQDVLLDLHSSFAKDEVHFSRITLR